MDIEQIPIPEDVDMEDGHGGKKRRRLPVQAMTYEEIEASILHSLWKPWVRNLRILLR